MPMEGFNEGVHGDREVHGVELDGDDRCIIDIGNYRLTYVLGNDEEIYLVGREKPGSHSPDLEDIPQAYLDRAKRVAEETLGLFKESEGPFLVTPGTLRDAEKHESLLLYGEEEVERQRRERNRPAIGSYHPTEKDSVHDETKEDGAGKQGELDLKNPK